MNEPTCETRRPELTALLYGELSSEERIELEEHLDHCSPCTRYLTELRATEELLASWKTPPVVEPASVVAGSVVRAAQKSRPGLWLRRAAAVAALVLGCLAVLGSELSLADETLTVRVGLPWSARPAQTTNVSGVDWEPMVRRIAAEEATLQTHETERRLDEWKRSEQEARAQLLLTLDQLRNEDQRVLAGLLDNFQSSRVRENRITREALVDLASLVTRPQ